MNTSSYTSFQRKLAKSESQGLFESIRARETKPPYQRCRDERATQDVREEFKEELPS